MDDDRVWSFEEGLWTGDAEHYRDLIDDECLMVVPAPPYAWAALRRSRPCLRRRAGPP